MVECSPATRAARVRFPADAHIFFIIIFFLIENCTAFFSPKSVTLLFILFINFYFSLQIIVQDSKYIHVYIERDLLNNSQLIELYRFCIFFFFFCLSIYIYIYLLIIQNPLTSII